MKHIQFVDSSVWLQIRLVGDMEGDIIFSFPEQVALKLVSSMMGGFTVTQLDEMSKSAISELGNMISGNASTLLSNQGIAIDITPPKMVDSSNQRTGLSSFSSKALNIPLKLSDIGELDIYVSVHKTA